MTMLMMVMRIVIVEGGRSGVECERAGERGGFPGRGQNLGILLLNSSTRRQAEA